MAIESLKTENTILKDKENSNLEYIEILLERKEG